MSQAESPEASQGNEAKNQQKGHRNLAHCLNSHWFAPRRHRSICDLGRLIDSVDPRRFSHSEHPGTSVNEDSEQASQLRWDQLSIASMPSLQELGSRKRVLFLLRPLPPFLGRI